MSRPKTAVQTSRQQANTDRFSYLDCPLSSPDLPIVSDTEHRAGHCFCHHCNCGIHTCPGESSKFQVSTSTGWASQYKKDFIPKHNRRETPIIPQEYKSFMKTSVSSKAISVSQSEFTPQQFIKSENFKPSSSFSEMKFSGRTSYERDFAGWKTEHNIMGSPNYPYRGYMVKPWNSESTYKNTYRGHPFQSNKIPSQTSSVKSLVSPGNQANFDTTSKSFYKKEKSLGQSSQDIARLRNKKEVYKLSTAKGHYVTAYSADYVPKPIGSTLTRFR